MKMSDTAHGIRFVSDGQCDIYVAILASDPKHGVWMLVGSEHQAVEVRVTPAGRKVEAKASALTPGMMDADRG